MSITLNKLLTKKNGVRAINYLFAVKNLTLDQIYYFKYPQMGETEFKLSNEEAYNNTDNLTYSIKLLMTKKGRRLEISINKNQGTSIGQKILFELKNSKDDWYISGSTVIVTLINPDSDSGPSEQTIKYDKIKKEFYLEYSDDPTDPVLRILTWKCGDLGGKCKSNTNHKAMALTALIVTAHIMLW